MAFCSRCGKELTGGNFCAGCGAPVGGAPDNSQPAYQPPQPKPVGAMDLIKMALAVLKQKPIRLWGVSLMWQLLSMLAVLLGVLPIFWLPVTLVLNAGMTAVFLAGYRGKEVKTDELFAGFQRFFKVAGAMGWRELWILIWSLIPVVGFVFGVIKSYAYRFVPYIIMQDPEITATEALRLSMKKSEGFKGRMFWADMLPCLACALVALILVLLGTIQGIGVFFLVLYVLFVLLMAVVLPLLLGLIGAAGYEEFFVKEGKGNELQS